MEVPGMEWRGWQRCSGVHRYSGQVCGTSTSRPPAPLCALVLPGQGPFSGPCEGAGRSLPETLAPAEEQEPPRASRARPAVKAPWRLSRKTSRPDRYAGLTGWVPVTPKAFRHPFRPPAPSSSLDQGQPGGKTPRLHCPPRGKAVFTGARASWSPRAPRSRNSTPPPVPARAHPAWLPTHPAPLGPASCQDIANTHWVHVC